MLFDNYAGPGHDNSEFGRVGFGPDYRSGRLPISSWVRSNILPPNAKSCRSNAKSLGVLGIFFLQFFFYCPSRTPSPGVSGRGQPTAGRLVDRVLERYPCNAGG